MSSQVQSGVLEKVQDLLPNQIGTNRAWATESVERHIMNADRLVRERTGNLYHQQEITLANATLEYALDTEFIDIVSVEFAIDGSTYDWYLRPITLDDLDKISLSWRDDGSARPEFYTLLSTPGLPSCKIQIYRPIATVGAQTILVTGLGIGTTTTTCPDDVQNKCHVPHVMSVLLAKKNPQEAASWFQQYVAGCEVVRRRTLSRHSKGTLKIGVGW